MLSETPLLRILREEITRTGSIPFARFMELCLYHPEYGYYRSERVKLGAAGDFYTSAHAVPVFARLLARHLEQCWGALESPVRFDWVELGPGDGQLAGELLSWVRQRFPEFFSCLRYTGIEGSARARNRLEEVLGGFGEKVTILGELPASGTESESETGFEGCIFANEFFDALPFHWLVWQDGRWRERYVGWAEDKMVWSVGEPSSPDLEREAESRFEPSLPPGEREEGWTAEVSPLAQTYMEAVARHLQRGEALIVDYGYTLEEWQQGRFPQGSAMAYRRHQVIRDLLALPGEQDLTAHVNFSQLMGAGKRCGLGLRSFQSQSKFLLALGQPDEFNEVFSGCNSEAERLRRSRLLKTLILPQAMGEAFRVLRMEKAATEP